MRQSCKAADIIMQERLYLSHRRRVGSVRPNRYIEALDKDGSEALGHVSRRLSFMDEINQRKRHELGQKNRQLLKRLLEIERRQAQQEPEHEVGHWNSYFTKRAQSTRIKKDNTAMLGRLIETGPAIPSKGELKRSFKKLARVIKLHQNFRKVDRLHRLGREMARRDLNK